MSHHGGSGASTRRGAAPADPLVLGKIIDIGMKSMDDGHASSRHYVSEAAVHTSQPLSSFHNRQSSDLSARHVSASAGSGSPRRAATMRTRTCSTCTETRGQALFISRAPGTRRHRVSRKDVFWLESCVDLPCQTLLFFTPTRPANAGVVGPCGRSAVLCWRVYSLGRMVCVYQARTSSSGTIPTPIIRVVTSFRFCVHQQSCRNNAGCARFGP